MSITTSVEGARRWVVTRAPGLVTYAELQEHLDQEEALRAVGDPEVFDATGATTDLTGAQVEALVRRGHAMLWRGAVGPTAFVADGDLAFGMARMYQPLAASDAVVVGVCRDTADAERWLADAAGARPG